MIQPACAGDEPALEAFLAKHPETSMFLRGNLALYGLFETQNPIGTRFFVEETNGIQAVFGITNSGYLMCQAPQAGPDFWTAFRQVLSGETVAGVTGDVHQVAQIKRVLFAKNAAFSLEETEPLFHLNLENLIDQGPSEIRTPTMADLPLLQDWFYLYDTETLGVPAGDKSRKRAKIDAQRSIGQGLTRLLIQNGQPVAKTTFNAVLPDMVQIGGVFTPHEFRNQGLARKVVAAHLIETRQSGVKTAILFASGPAACRAYEAIGFKQIGEYAVAILTEPQVIESRP